MRVRTVAAVLLLALLAAGCSSAQGGPNGTSGASNTAPVSSSQPFTIPAPDSPVSSPPSSPTTSSTTASSTPSLAPVRSSESDIEHPTTTATRRVTSSVKTTTGHPAWTPPDYGSAKPAVDAYLKVIDALNRGLENPKHPPTTMIEKYSQGPGRGVVQGAIADEKAQGRAWRGSPPPSRVLVKTNKVKADPAEVVLSDCPLPSPTWVEYDVTTGKSVPQPKYDPPAPYAVSITMFRLNGIWVMTSFTVDGSKTCAR